MLSDSNHNLIANNAQAQDKTPGTRGEKQMPGKAKGNGGEKCRVSEETRHRADYCPSERYGQ
jgi:hypothetical protein